MSDSFFISEVLTPEKMTNMPWWFIFCGEQLLTYQQTTLHPIPALADISELKLDIAAKYYLGHLDNTHCFAVEITKESHIPENMGLQTLRETYDQLGDILFNLAGRALQILNWNKNHQFCSRCGHKTYEKEDERVKICPECLLHSYPRLSPSIIVLIHRNKEILLARSAHFRPGIYSVLAGFIEPGETAEQATQREVMEEVGIYVKNIQYKYSQPWPFPDSFMLGFTAEYESGDICVNKTELEDARWYPLHRLPQLPFKASIAHRLIDDFLKEQK